VCGVKGLVISVGTGTGGVEAVRGLAKAIAFSVEHHNPDKVFFVVTKQSRSTLPLILENLRDRRYEVVELSDPENVQVIYEELRSFFSRVRDECDYLSVDYTSGTKSMSAALAMIAFLYEVEELSYIKGKRVGGVVQSGSEQILPIRPYFVVAERKVRLAVQFFNRSQFSATIDVLQDVREMTRDPDVVGWVEPLLDLAEAYSLWDRFRHKEAFERLREVKMQEVNRNKRFLGRLTYKAEKGEPEPYYIADLLNNAERRAGHEGKYDDAVARLYRTIELIGQYALRREYGISSSEVRPEEVPERLLREWGAAKDRKLRIGLEKEYELLNALGHTLGRRFMEDKELRTFLSKRNLSILAHGVTPVSREVYEKLHRKTLDYARTMVEDLDGLTRDSKFIQLREY